MNLINRIKVWLKKRRLVLCSRCGRKHEPENTMQIELFSNICCNCMREFVNKHAVPVDGDKNGK